MTIESTRLLRVIQKNTIIEFYTLHSEVILIQKDKIFLV